MDDLRVVSDHRCRNCQLFGTMIPHAAFTLAGARGPLVVAVVGPPLVAGSVLLAGSAGRFCPATLAASLAAVHVAAIAPPVDPEFGAALLARTRSELQLSSTRSKNWTPSPTGRILPGTSTLCGAPALPHEGSELRTPGLRPFYDPRCPPASAQNPSNATFTPGWYPGSGDPADSGTRRARRRQRPGRNRAGTRKRGGAALP